MARAEWTKRSWPAATVAARYTDGYGWVSIRGGSNVGGRPDFGLRLRAIWASPNGGWEHWRVMGLLSWFQMLKDAEDSPVVDIAGNDDQILGGVVVAYQN